MADSEPPEHSTLVIAALMILALAFAAAWIATYVEPGSNPRALLPWFGAGAAVIIIWGLVTYIRPRRKDRDDKGRRA